ncbi:hypothetical protein KEM48_007179 [Puccinia striiformis f. sp. tritici PST-130]|nr:hypothetical protein KEM48_007179 [Puccinia striiformis f. sp. tritici PST-130]
MQSFNHSRAMSTHGDPYNIRRPMSVPPLRSESRNFNLGGRYPGDQLRAQNVLQRRPSNYQLDRQTYADDDEDYEYCRPRGSTIGELDQDNFGRQPQHRASFGGNLGRNNNMYGSAYGVGMMSSSPREQMMRAQMMRGDLYAMDPMMDGWASAVADTAADTVVDTVACTAEWPVPPCTVPARLTALACLLDHAQ